MIGLDGMRVSGTTLDAGRCHGFPLWRLAVLQFPTGDGRIAPMMQPLLRAAAALAGLVGLLALAGPAAALDLNSFRAQHRLPALSVSSELLGAAYEHAHALAGRGRLDHAGFRQRVGSIASTAAENVAYRCESEDCVIKMWSRSAGHRRNMLMKGVTRYGIASATGGNGRTYWVLELGN
jgi:hypothetical protein